MRIGALQSDLKVYTESWRMRIHRNLAHANMPAAVLCEEPLGSFCHLPRQKHGCLCVLCVLCVETRQSGLLQLFFVFPLQGE